MSKPPQLYASTGDRVENRGGRIEAGRRIGATTVALVALLGLAVAVAPTATGSGSTSRTPLFGLSWLSPTPADGRTYTVPSGTRLSVGLSAGGQSAATQISASGLPAGAVLTTAAGAPATGKLNWMPTEVEVGTHAFVFVGRSVGGEVVTRPRTIFVQVVPATPPTANEATPIGTDGVYRWAYVAKRTAVRSRPSSSARVITHLSVFTSDDTVNLVLLLARATDIRGRVWYRARLPMLPNNSTGWVLSGALTTTRAVSTYLVIYRKLFTATLYRNGRPVFRTRVGVGKPYWPTPAGDFYIREVLTGFNDPFYGPVAFGTSARSAVLTDWPGGGVIGIHGTSIPQILPGRVSHGCVRMKNGPIRQLLRLMPLGTPLAIR